MGLSKDMFIEAQEELTETRANELMAGGMPEDEAWEKAEEYYATYSGCDEIADRATDALADFADRLRDEAKERRVDDFREGGAI